jgi:oligoendopeptidase F
MNRSLFNRNLAVTLTLLGLLLFALPAGAGDLPKYEPDANHSRDQVPDAYKWDLSPLFPSDAACDEAMEQLRGRIPELASYKGKLSDPAALKKCLDLYFDLHDRTSHVQQYANLALNTELTNEDFQARKQLSLSLMDEVMAAAGFIRGEILAMDDESMTKAYKDKNGPAQYKDYMDNLRRRKSRVLTPEAERILAMAGDNLWAEIDLNEIPSPIETAFGAILSDIAWPMVHDADGNEVQLTLANYGRFRRSSKREVRAEAVTDFFATLRQFQHAFAATLGGQFKLDVMYARARHYDTALEAYMDKDNLDTAVHDNLIKTVNANLKPLHRYVELRKKVMGLDDLHIYDLYVPMVAAAEMDVPFADAQRMITEALKPLGKDYGKLLKKGLDPKTGWLDLYPSNDKRSGAFSASVYGRPPYVFMNYQNSLDDMSTLAHEYGHALHSYLAMSNQPYHNYRYVAFLAEIASTCDEALLSDYLIAHAKSKEAKAGLLAAELETIRTTIYRQTLFSEFERMAHGYVEEGTPITASLLNKTYGDLIKRYYGPGFTMDLDDDMEWAYIPHFYYKYYVYSYATGLCSGIAIAELVKEKGDEAAENFLGMLKGGCSDAPLELLRGAGVDLTKPDAIESALKRFDRRITELADLLGVEI